MWSSRLLVRTVFVNLRSISLAAPRSCLPLDKQNVVRSPFPDLHIPDISLNEYLWRNTDKWSDKTAVICSQTGRNYNYSQVNAMSKNVAQALTVKMGLKKGDVIAVMMPNIPEFCVAVLGAIRAGIVVTTINPIYTADEVEKQLKDSNSKAIITLSLFSKLVNEAIKNFPSSLPLITCNQPGDPTPQGAIDFKELCEYSGKTIKLAETKGDDVCLLPYSSGTTGLPKGVVLTHKNIVSVLCQFHSPGVKLCLDTTNSFQDVTSVVLPMFHAYGLILLFLSGFSEGCKLVTMQRFTPDGYFNMLLKYKPTLLFGVPPIILFLNNYEPLQLEHMKNVRYVTSGAAPLSSSDIGRFNEKFKEQIKILQGYGLTETSGLTHTQGLQQSIHPGGSGWPLPNTECRIVSLKDDKINLGHGQSGHLLIRGPQIMKAYQNNPQATKETIVDGWLLTGDIGHYDEGGHFYITDRIKELIKVKGLQVAPAELEALLRNHPDVADVGVTSIPHATNGEAPKAFIVLKSGAKLQAEQIHEYVNKQVASFKRLTGGVVFVDSIPKTMSGKILRKNLKNM